jgi:predicted aminopeptidase
MRGLFLFACIAFALGGCAPSYKKGEGTWLFKQAVGQVEVLVAARPISRVLRDPRTDEKLRRRLSLLQAVRTFARDRLGLDVGPQYRSVTFLDGPAVVYVVSAAPRDSLDPHTWTYPLLGALPYRGYFDAEEAEHEALRLFDEGLDVSVRPVITYSLLGLLPEPVLSPMLSHPDPLRLVEVVIHELAHGTLFVPGQGAFNEGMATFIGREGRRLFVEEVYGKKSAIHRRMALTDADRDLFSRSVAALAFDLRVLYARSALTPLEEILDERAQVFRRHQAHFNREVAPSMFTYALRKARLPDNNAELMSTGIYTLQQHLYADAYALCGKRMGCFLDLLKKVAAHPEPENALANHVAERKKREGVLR